MNTEEALLELDLSHTRLQDLIRKLGETGRNNYQFLPLIGELAEFTMIHLAFEHRLLRDLGVADPDHSLKHKYLQDEFREILHPLLTEKTDVLVARTQALFQDHLDATHCLLQEIVPRPRGGTHAAYR